MLFFAIGITAAYLFVLPDGRILRANFDFLAPVTLVGSIVCGVVWGLLQRSRD